MYKWAMESVGTVLFECRLGCLDDPLPPNVQSFINAIAEMLSTLTPLTLNYNLHKKFRSSYWKRHFAASDTMFDFVKNVVDRFHLKLFFYIIVS